MGAKAACFELTDNFLPTNKYYPLELKDCNIHLYAEDGTHKWVIGYFIELDHEEGPEFKFCGERPFGKRVNWNHFKELIKQGYENLTKTEQKEND